MSDSWLLCDQDYGTLEKMLEALNGVALLPTRPGVVNLHMVESEIAAVKREMAQRDAAYMWKCPSCGHKEGTFATFLDPAATLFGLTARQISKLRTKWLRDGKKIEDL